MLAPVDVAALALTVHKMVVLAIHLQMAPYVMGVVEDGN